MLSRASNPSPVDADTDMRRRRRIFAVAFLVRVLYIVLAHTYRIRPEPDHFDFGFEMGRIGRALALGRGYADPFVGHTGPTAWSPPLYTLLIGAVFRVFGVYTAMSAFVLETLDSALSAITAVGVYEIGSRCFSPRIGLWSGWLWALHPAAMQYAVRWIWEMTATTALFTWLFVLVLRMRGTGTGSAEPEHVRQSWRRWCWFGAGFGALALTNPSPITMSPVMALLLLLASGLPQPKIARQRIAKATLAGVLVCGIVAPWAARNWLVFHRFIPFRDNFGAENYMGNGPWSNGFPWGTTVPLENRRIEREYASMGEPAWTADRGAKAKHWIATHRAAFVQLSIKRAWLFWAGVPKSVEEGGWKEYARLMEFQFLSLAGLLGLILAVRRRQPGWALLLLSFVLLPLPYYLVTAQARFRHVLEPLIFTLGVFLFASAEPGRFGSAVAGWFCRTALGSRFRKWTPWFRGDPPHRNTTEQAASGLTGGRTT